jgi:hypothetical protein
MMMETYPGEDAWCRRPLGRPGGLADKQKEVLAKLMVDVYVREFGTEHAVRWTLARTAGIIKSEFGATCSLMYVSNVLTALAGDGKRGFRFSSRFWTSLIERVHPELVGRVRLHVPGVYQRDRVAILGVRRRLLSLFGYIV